MKITASVEELLTAASLLPRSKVSSKTLTGCERERSKANISWLLDLSRGDVAAVRSKLAASPALATTVCHLTGLAPVHWAVKHDNKELVRLLFRNINNINMSSHCNKSFRKLTDKKDLLNAHIVLT